MTKNILFAAIFTILITTLPANAKKIKTFQPLTIPPLNVQNTIEPEITESYPKINQLELIIFKRNFERESIYNRLSRLENKIFKENYPHMSLASRVDNLLNNVDSGLIYNIPQKELARLEVKVLGRVYPNDDTESRITRLEKEMLGAMQGGNLSERFNTVKIASKHYNSYPEIVQSQNIYQNYSSPYGMNNFSSSPKRGFGGFMQNVMSVLFGGMPMGTMTGFTPPIYDPYNPYAQTAPYSPIAPYHSFMNPGSGEQDYFMSNRGGYINNRNIGSHSTVRILD